MDGIEVSSGPPLSVSMGGPSYSVRTKNQDERVNGWAKRSLVNDYLEKVYLTKVYLGVESQPKPLEFDSVNIIV